MIFWLLYIIGEAWGQNKFLLSKGKKPFYLLLFLFRGFVSIVFGALILDVQQDLIETVIMLGWQICSFYVLFDFILNKFRGKPWNYKGKNSGWLDKLPYTYWYILKVICIFGAILFYLKGLEIWII
jgi:hypothetical protein